MSAAAQYLRDAPAEVLGYPDVGLSYRAHNILRYAGIPATKESVRQALHTGQLLPIKHTCGCGEVTHAELCRWAGVTARAANPD